MVRHVGKAAQGSNGAVAAVDGEDEGNEVGDYKVPDDDQWKALKRYRSFKLPGNSQHFALKQFVYIRPGLSETEPKPKKKSGKQIERIGGDSDGASTNGEPWWIAMIQEIRAEDERNVFILVRWMYTTMQQLRDSGCGRLPRKIIGHEIFLSNFSDRLPVHCVEDTAPVVFFDENTPSQDPITITDVFYRSEIRKPNPGDAIETRAKDVSPAQPKKKRKASRKSDTDPERPVLMPYADPSCICRKPYTPLPLEKHPMLYCPHPACRKWYHRACVERDPSYRTAATSGHLLTLRTSGLDLLRPASATACVKTEAPPTPKSSRTAMVIPADVQRAAESSIIRGTLESGLVGDGRKVLLARTIIASASDADAQDRLSGWQGEFGDENAKVEPRREVWLCLGCNGPI